MAAFLSRLAQRSGIQDEWAQEEGSGSWRAFSADLRGYSVGFAEGRIEIRSARGAKLLQTLPGPGATAWVARFSSDGQHLAVKYHGRGETDRPLLCIWNVESGKPAFSRNTAVSSVALDFDPAGRVLVEVDGKGEERRLSVSDIPVAIRFRPDGGAIAVATAGSGVDVIEAGSGRLIRRLSHTAPVTSIDWSSDGTRLAAGYRDFRALV